MRPMAHGRLAGIIVLSLGTTAMGQSGGPLDFGRPQLAMMTEGHHAPVHSLRFTADGRQLLSAGQDKTVLVWDLTQDPPVVVRRIRPPIYSGSAGTIHAMALSPVDPDGQAILAVAGIGVTASRGEIRLYRFPGPENRPTGDVIGELPGDLDGRLGHSRSVNALAFSADGRRLASCGSDGTVRLWDVAARRLLGTTTAKVDANGTSLPLNALAFPTGDRIVTGGVDGVIRTWDAARLAAGVAEAQVVERPYLALPNDPPSGELERQVLSLDVGQIGDRRAVFAGYEGGQLARFDDFDALTPTRLLGPVNVRGAVGPLLTLATRADGRSIAFAQVREALARPGDRPTTTTDLFAFDPATNQARPLDTLDNAIRAIAFGPGNRWLAYSGGNDHTIVLRDLTNDAPPRLLRGRGHAVLRVGWARASDAVGFVSDLSPQGPASMFDLAGRALADPMPRETLSGPIATWNGWRVEPTGPFALDLISPTGRRRPIVLDPQRDRRWWDYSFLPPGPGRNRPTLAVAFEQGVAIYSVEEPELRPRRLRYLAGHVAAVRTIAPSPDGRYLATGSADQTVRIWSLAEFDRVPPFGAEFRREGDGIVVAAVTPGGFADRAGLRPGDRPVRFGIGPEFVAADRFLREADPSEPGHELQMEIHRGHPEFVTRVGTTKRDRPLLTLFAPDDGQWILWTGEGYYDTSIEGDAKHLGWHRNGSDSVDPTEFHAAEVFETALRRRDMIDWTFRNARRPPAPGAAVLDVEAPPVVRFVEPAGVVGETFRIAGRSLRVEVEVDRAARDRLARLDLARGTQAVPLAEPLLDPNADRATRIVEIDLEPGFQVVTARATNASGRTTTEAITVYCDPPPEPKERRLAVLSFGASGFARTIPPVPFADADATLVGAFLEKPGGESRFRERFVTIRPSSKTTTGSGLLTSLDELAKFRADGLLGRGDTVLLHLETHFYTDPTTKARFLLGSDARLVPPQAGAVRVEEITDRLRGLTDYGCRVMVLLDLRHKETPKAWLGDRGLDEWARELHRSGVITFVGSVLGPGEALAPSRSRAFADGVARSLNARGIEEREGPLPLGGFARNVINRVQEQTGRRQRPFCSIPPAIDPRTPILDPLPPDPPAGARSLASSGPDR